MSNSIQTGSESTIYLFVHLFNQLTRQLLGANLKNFHLQLLFQTSLDFPRRQWLNAICNIINCEFETNLETEFRALTFRLKRVSFTRCSFFVDQALNLSLFLSAISQPIKVTKCQNHSLEKTRCLVATKCHFRAKLWSTDFTLLSLKSDLRWSLTLLLL